MNLFSWKPVPSAAAYYVIQIEKFSKVIPTTNKRIPSAEGQNIEGWTAGDVTPEQERIIERSTAGDYDAQEQTMEWLNKQLHKQ